MPLSTGRIEVRLSAAELEQLSHLRQRLATPVLPSVAISDVVRAGLRALATQLDAPAAPAPVRLGAA